MDEKKVPTDGEDQDEVVLPEGLSELGNLLADVFGDRGERPRLRREEIRRVLYGLAAANYEIVPSASRSSANELAALSPGLLARLGRLEEMEHDELLWLWDELKDTPPVRDVYCRFGKRLLDLGEPLWAHDIFCRGLKLWSHKRLRQLDALALARGGATNEACEALVALRDEGNTDGETLGILARTYKDMGEQAVSPAEQRKFWGLSRDTYFQAFRQAKKNEVIKDQIYTGINAATMAVLAEPDEASVMDVSAGEVAGEVFQTVQAMEKKDYWDHATLAEASLILGEMARATELYGEAARLGRREYGRLVSTRRNARMLLRATGRQPDALDHLFEIPNVVVFAGHRIDAEGCPGPRFPAELEEKVRLAIRDKLQELDAGFGFCSAACGSDILFIEEMLERKAEVTVVLAYPKEDFPDHCVSEGWRARYQAILDNAGVRKVETSERRLPANAVALEYASQVQVGLARLRGETLDTRVLPLVVWDGRPGHRDGGTASMVDYWHRAGRSIEIIEIEELRTGHEPGQAATDPRPEGPIVVDDPSEPGEMVMAPMLFADVKSFSKLTDQEVPLFMHKFIALVADLARSSRHAPIAKNTWGDGLFFVFSSVEAAGVFAMELRARLDQAVWTDLSRKFTLRIALHAGPVYRYDDLVLNRQNYFGNHVNLVARLEPATTPGQIFTTQAFAAMAAAQRVSSFACDYRGKTVLPKGAGIIPAYQLRPR